MRFIPGIQGWFNICETINVIYLINKLKNKNHMIIDRCRKSFWQISTSIYDKNSQQRGVEGTFLNIIKAIYDSSVQLLSRVRLCDPMNRSTPGLPVHHQLPGSTQTHVHWVGDAIQPSHPLLSPSPPALNLSQHQGLFKWVSSSHEVAKVLEFQLQHQSFQWTPRTDLL